MNDPQNGHGLIVDAEINTAFAVGESSQAWAYPITRHPRESGLPNPLNLCVEVGHELGSNAYVLLCEINKYLGQVVLRLGRDN